MPNAPAATEPALTAAEFAARLDRLGPFEPCPRLAIGVSGGADSLALAVLAAAWAQARGGRVLALIVDHGLRPEAAQEAAITRQRLRQQGIQSHILGLDLARGPALAARARDARLDCLMRQARAEGILHLLLGHHAGDQAETWLMRARAGSGPAGLAGIASVREGRDVRLLRPLLDVPRCRLQAVLHARGLAWVEDPSNRDLRAQRARLRAELADPRGDGAATLDLLARAGLAGRERATAERRVAAELAARVTLSPLGYAVISPGPIAPASLSALWRTLSGSAYPPPVRAIAALAAEPRPATLCGLRLLPAGRLGPGWLLVRETPPAPVRASHGARWDRFLLHAPGLPAGLMIGAAPAQGCARPALPASIHRALPALWQGDRLFQPPPDTQDMPRFRFAPPLAAADTAWFN